MFVALVLGSSIRRKFQTISHSHADHFNPSGFAAQDLAARGLNA